MHLYNTLTRRVEPFVPLLPDDIRLYSCGPTVYDHVHIGNLSAFIVADTLRRVLASEHNHITHTMNYTDVDDKTIRRSHERYPELEPRSALQLLADEYIRLFRGDMQAVGNDLSAFTFLRATDTPVIAAMQRLITQLYKHGIAYTADDGVYFSIAAYCRSGKMYGQLLELNAANTSEARIDNDEYDKESAHDFALWKLQKNGEPAWDFELDGHGIAGRPGWHIECSAMSRMGLGQPFDIHTGGVDLIFPHHENEIAQSTALETNPVMATMFVHNEHMLVDGRKMSKSLGNFYRLTDVIAAGFEPLAFRLHVLQSHYRSQSHFSWDILVAAQQRLHNFRQAAVLMHQPSATPNPVNSEQLQASLQRITDVLRDDLNTPVALAELSTQLDNILSQGITIREQSSLCDYFVAIDALLGLGLSILPDILPEQKNSIAKRETARAAHDWAAADNLRAQLAQDGIAIRDTPHGTLWYYTR